MVRRYYGDEEDDLPRGIRKSEYTPERGQSIVDLIYKGFSLYAIAHMPDQPSYTTIWRWRKEQVAFDDDVREAEHRRGPLKASGRPPLKDEISEDLQNDLDDIVKLLTQGALITDACFMIGINRTKFYKLLRTHPTLAKTVEEAQAIAKEKRS